MALSSEDNLPGPLVEGFSSQLVKKPEVGSPWPLCPEPERWSMIEGNGAEVEVLHFLEALVVLLKPRIVVETGTYLGWSAGALARGCHANGFGHVWTYEIDAGRARQARNFLCYEKLSPRWVTVLVEDAREARLADKVELLFCDGGEDRVDEIRHWESMLADRAIVVAHDAVSKTYLWERLESGYRRVLLPTPRGLWIMQKI